MTRPWTLRARLVLSVVGLLALASVVIGIVSVAALRESLLDRLDRQLVAASVRSGDYDDRVPYDQGPGPGIRPEFVAIGTVSAIAVDGLLGDAAYFDERAQRRVLTDDQRAGVQGLPVDGSPHTVELGELGRYRMIAQPVDDRLTVIVGLPLRQTESILAQLVGVVALVTVLGIVIAALAAALIVRLALRPLDRVVATASHVAELPLDRGDVGLAVRVPDRDSDPRTEVGKVGASFNRMLGHVASALAARQESERKVRQFVSDASHELRTPLASIRGYSELTRRAGHDLPPDIVHAMSRVESEAKRMTSLVEDLLLLARLDEGRALESKPVDLSRLLIDAVSDARAAGVDHKWKLELPEEPVVVPGDGARLHQVVANLLTNARVHTPAGTTVTVTARATDAAIITVGDDGPGIGPELQAELFERFARGDGSRSRIAGSTGLGLAIARSVVDGHLGSIVVDSSPGSTVFSVRLPLAGA